MAYPIIGVTPSLNNEESSLIVSRSTLDAICAAGGIPMILPITNNMRELASIIDNIDGCLLSGGGDVDPIYFGENISPHCGGINPERDAMQIPLAKMLAERKKPTLGICRGAQVMNIAFGGDIYQDIGSQYTNYIAHKPAAMLRHATHTVTIVRDSQLSSIVKAEQYRVNSSHHQAIRALGKGIQLAAKAPDDIIEAIELPDHPFYIGVQWHPEKTFATSAEDFSLFAAFVDACKTQMHGKYTT